MASNHEKIKKLRNNPLSAVQRGECWNKELDAKLKKLYDEGYGITEIALKMERTENSIFLRIKDRGLDQRIYDTHTKHKEAKETIQEICLCSKCTLYGSCEPSGLHCRLPKMINSADAASKVLKSED